ncbi:unnamed protein product [Blepharisma stoltei]|uniref:Uncharacterized protein n=1 Tax=Blepharisma stoltei TaxID=1481888 RepID=A0AAU9JSE8_9CILI|nr:unnamed protein product [Blepharisma stoltei]
MKSTNKFTPLTPLKIEKNSHFYVSPKRRIIEKSFLEKAKQESEPKIKRPELPAFRISKSPNGIFKSKISVSYMRIKQNYENLNQNQDKSEKSAKILPPLIPTTDRREIDTSFITNRSNLDSFRNLPLTYSEVPTPGSRSPSPEFRYKLRSPMLVHEIGAESLKDFFAKNKNKVKKFIDESQQTDSADFENIPQISLETKFKPIKHLQVVIPQQQSDVIPSVKKLRIYRRNDPGDQSDRYKILHDYLV